MPQRRLERSISCYKEKVSIFERGGVSTRLLCQVFLLNVLLSFGRGFSLTISKQFFFNKEYNVWFGSVTY